MGYEFRPYLCNVNGKLASILVDLSLRSDAPIETKPWLLWVWVYFQTPRTDGLSSSDEAHKLYEIEDALILRICREGRALMCGRITTDGRREFYLYGEVKDGFEEAVATALADFAEYRFDLGAQEDPSWTQYLEVLYPSQENLERIKNGDLLDVLTYQGDVHTVPRNVLHWAYFPSRKSRALFRMAATGAGFLIDSEYKSEGDRPFCICVSHVQAIQQEQIDTTTIELLRLAQRFDGEYTGWETPVISQ